MSSNKSPLNDRAIPWRRPLIESVVIILSILLAFAIDASWDEFKERNQEEAFLVSSLNEFKATRSRIDESNEAHMSYITSGKQLLGFHGVDTPNIAPEAIEILLGDIFFDFESLYVPSGSRDALFSSGDIDIITNQELRALLADWPSRVADAAEDESLIANDVMNKMAPYLNSKVRTRNVARVTISDAANNIPLIEPVDYNILWKDPEFDNIVTFRLLNETYAISENGKLRDAADEIIRLLEVELNH